MEDSTTISLKRRITVSLRTFKTSWDLRPWAIILFLFGASLEIGGFILSLFATAKLGGLLAAFVTSGSKDGIWFWLAVDIAAGLLVALGFLAMSQARRLIYFSFVRWSTNQFLQALCRIDLADFYDEERRNQINKASNGYTWQMSNLSSTNLDLLYALMRFAAITIVVSQITWWLVPLIGLFLIPSLIGEARMAKLQWFVWDQKGDQRHIFWGLDWIIKHAKGQMELRSSQARKYVLARIDSMNADFYGAQEVEVNKANKVLIPTKIMEVAGTAIGAIIVLQQFLSKAISLERYFFLSGALLRIGGALNAIFGTLTRMQETVLFADTFYDVIDQQPKIIDHPGAKQISTKKVPEIVFESVDFTYPNQDRSVFTDLNLVIKPGEHLALVGENGAGKSTLIKLLLRYYLPTAGRILIDGVDLRDLSIESWYDYVATLFQEFNQYPLPIDENITIGKSNSKPNEKLLKDAADFGGVTEIVDGYKHGWKTVLDSSFEKGVEPSGGQWQRIALARAFYRDAKVLILDEPTSAIDAKAEYTIFNNIFEHYKNKTALIVSHRFSTVRRADRILVLEGGQIVEQGSHHELMKTKGYYHDLFTKQAEGYLD